MPTAGALESLDLGAGNRARKPPSPNPYIWNGAGAPRAGGGSEVWEGKRRKPGTQRDFPAVEIGFRESGRGGRLESLHSCETETAPNLTHRISSADH